MLKTALAEIVGTFIIVFIGTGAMVADTAMAGKLTALGVCLIWGFAVFLAIIVAERIGQGHFNPAVTIVSAIKERFGFSTILLHIFFQCIGAILASIVLSFFAPSGSDLGATVPRLELGYVFLIEVVISFCLLAVIEFTVIKKLSLFKAALIIGIYVFIAAIITGPYTGCSMNPARTLGPFLIGTFKEALWLYITAPILGMLLAYIAFRPLSKAA
jgi:aquaporin NIP